MRKKLFKFLVFFTILSALASLFYLYFFCYRLHLISKSFTTSEDYESSTSFTYSITDMNLSTENWNSPEAILSLQVENSGNHKSSKYYYVSLTLVDISTDDPTIIGIDADTTKWTGNSISTLDIPVSISDLGFGQYELYFMIWDDSNANPISLDNNLEFTKYGYYIGSLSVSHFIFN